MIPKPVSIAEPSHLVVQAPGTQAIAGGTRITVALEQAGHAFDLFYEVMGSPVARDGSSSLAALLPLAMKRHWQLNLRASVSPRLMEATKTIQDIFALWEPGSAPVEITASGSTADAVS